MLHSLVITLPMSVSFFWLLAFLLTWRSNYAAKHVLTVFFAFSTLLYTCHWLYFSGFRSSVFETLYFIANLSVYPLFFYYIITLSGEKIRRYLWLMAPAAVIAIALPVCFIANLDEVRNIFSFFARICFALQVAYVWICGSRLIRSLIKRLDDYFSDDRSEALRKLNNLLWLFGIIAVCSGILNFIGREVFDDSDYIAVPSLLMTILLYMLGFVTVRMTNPTQGFAITEEPEFTATKPGEAKAGEDRDKMQLSQKLDEIMKEQKLYLRPDLTINDVVHIIGSNRTYLSAAINRAYGVNFYTYINTFRIEEAKRILTQTTYLHDKQAIVDALEKSGFTSGSTFYRVFKELTGTTPLGYRRSTLHK